MRLICSTLVARIAPILVLASPLVATADTGPTDNAPASSTESDASTTVFVQGVVGYSSPVAGTQYMEGVGDAAARVGIRGGWTPLVVGNAQLGFDVTLDWRPAEGPYGEGAQELRAIAGPRLAFVSDRYMTYFRLAVGYHRLALGDTEYVNATGVAVEPGFGAALRRGSLLFGGEVGVPLALHLDKRGSEYLDGYAGADFQVLLSVGSQL